MQLQGFTLIESILATSIILLLGGAVSAFNTQFFSARDTVVAIHILRESLDRAQVYARSGRQDSDWGVVQVGTDIVVFSGATYALRTAGQDEFVGIPGGISMVGLGETVFARSTGRLPAAKIIDIDGADRTLHLSISEEGTVNEYE
ncbi:MAG: prepilin-type N-terminal cleavage/methylation domain-containing protein [Candidatus Moraniibacteriota bacterium]|nr:MAG: prepilin-type N-terminal cleavage/methylation domain-containing protein [Candidatus Moranbacteria bacterium]